MRLVERGDLLDRLDGCLGQARAAGRLALVGGEAGVGKTSLVRRFVETRAHDLGFRVLWGACDPLSTPRPLAPFRDMTPLAPMLEEERGKHGLLTALLDELSADTVMVVEDAHWADGATLDALRFVGRRVTGTRSLVLVTYRDDEVGADHPLRAVLGDLATAPGCERLRVPALTPTGVRELAAGEALDPDHLHRVTGGNAFYVSEVLASPGWTVPLSVTDAVLARVSRLPADARALVDLVSVAPGGLEPEVAGELLDGLGAALDEAVGRGVLALAGSRVSFRHELARLAIESAVAAGRRRELHRRLVDLLEARPAPDPARLAHHAEAAGDAPRVLRYGVSAAGEASDRGSHREAARQLERVIAHGEGLPADRLADLLSLWAEERRGFDEPGERAALLTRIIELRRQSGDARGTGVTLTLLARIYYGMGRSREGFECAAEAIATLEPLGEGPELAHAYAGYSMQEMTAHHGEEALRWGRLAVDLAERVEAPLAQLMALNAIGLAQLECFERLEGIDDLERAARLAEAHRDDYEVGRALGNLGAGLGEIRHYEQAEAYLERAISFSEERDLDDTTGHATADLAKIRFEQGRWDEAERLAASALRHREVSLGIPIIALYVRGRTRVRRGDPDAAVFLDEAWALARDTGDLSWIWPVTAARAETAWLAGRETEVAALVEPAYGRACAAGLRWAIGELGSWLLRTGALERLPADVPSAFGLRGRPAAAAWREIGCPYEEAEALADGDEDALRESLAILTRLGAEPAADRVRETMRRTGLRRVPARPRASTRTAPAELTRRQLEVLALVESGLSDAAIAQTLFISKKTAGHHVSAILRKLGARSAARPRRLRGGSGSRRRRVPEPGASSQARRRSHGTHAAPLRFTGEASVARPTTATATAAAPERTRVPRPPAASTRTPPSASAASSPPFRIAA
jgi:DNA-binding CsgD family transcriptional regulator/tetratricopeptide (TPR) repeat protein